jgi:hypothetical protein
VQKHFEPIKEGLLQAFPVTPVAVGDKASLFGGPSVTSIEIPLALEIQKPENGPRAREVIREVIESQKALEKDKKSADFLLNQLKKANTCVQNAISSGLKPEANKTGVAEQIGSIEAGLSRIKGWLRRDA